MKQRQSSPFLNMTKQTKMPQPVYGNINIDGTQEINGRIEGHQTGIDSVKTRSSRATPVCLVLLCFLLLTAVIVLCVFIYTNNTNYTRERNQLLGRITNITDERDELLIKNGNLSKKIDELEKQLPIIGKKDGWIYNQFSFYYMSNEKKNWTESRRDCQKRRADLVIINDKEEQDFVMKTTHKKEFWIGLTDSEEEGTWKWVDGSVDTSGFWASNEQIKEPNGNTAENCAVTYKTEWPGLLGWIDITCINAYQWICEKSILSLTVA